MEKNLVVIATYKYSRAILLKGRLDAEGIEAYLANVNLVQSDISSGVKVLIKKDDIAAATRIIREIAEEYGEEDEPKKSSLIKFHRILVPVDFSEYSLNACDYALSLAGKLNAEIRLFHSYYNPTSVASAFPDAFSYELGMGGIKSDIKEIAKEEMKSFKAKVESRAAEKGLKDVKVSAALAEGIPGNEIPEAARKYKPQLIVIGTKGVGEKDADLVGHVTAELIDNTDYPVFAVPVAANFKEIENSQLLYVTDFDDPDFSSFRKLISIIAPFNMKIHCVHVGDEKLKPYDAVQMEVLEKKIKRNYVDFQVEFHLIEHKDIVKGIDKFVKEQQIDIMALSNRKHSFLYRLFNTSNARKILYHTRIPLLVFQIKED